MFKRKKISSNEKPIVFPPSTRQIVESAIDASKDWKGGTWDSGRSELQPWGRGRGKKKCDDAK